MSWTGARRTFAVKTVFKIGEFAINTQRAFHVYYMLYQNDAVSDRKSILLQVKNSITDSPVFWGKKTFQQQIHGVYQSKL